MSESPSTCEVSNLDNIVKETLAVLLIIIVGVLCMMAIFHFPLVYFEGRVGDFSSIDDLLVILWIVGYVIGGTIIFALVLSTGWYVAERMEDE